MNACYGCCTVGEPTVARACRYAVLEQFGLESILQEENIVF